MFRSTLAAIALLLLTALPAAAESAEWTADPPKQVGMPVIWCTATTTHDGDTYTLRNYVPIDDDFDEVRYANRVFSEDVVRAMLYRFPGRSHVIQPSDVTVKCG